jgi:heme exporter protein C
MKRLFPPLLIVAAVMFAFAPILIAQAPYESTMLLIQKIMYFHAPSGMVMLVSGLVAGIASAIFLARRSLAADHVAVAAAELTAIYGLIVLLTGPIWARKAWGVWWTWDPRLTMSFVGWLISLAYLVVRKYGGPGSEKLAAGLAIFGAANVPFIYISVNIWRTIHPQTTVASSLPPSMAGPFWFTVLAFFLLYSLLMTARVHLERQRAALDQLYLAAED